MGHKRRNVVEKFETEMSEVSCVEYCIDEHKAASMKKGRPVYTARVVEKEVYYLEDTIDRMRTAGCAVNKSVIRLVLDEYFSMVKRLTAQGRAVAIPGIVRFAPTIRGTFDSEDEPFDSKKHKIVIQATVSKKLLNIAKNSPARRVVVGKARAPKA